MWQKKLWWAWAVTRGQNLVARKMKGQEKAAFDKKIEEKSFFKMVPFLVGFLLTALRWFLFSIFNLKFKILQRSKIGAASLFVLLYSWISAPVYVFWTMESKQSWGIFFFPIRKSLGNNCRATRVNEYIPIILFAGAESKQLWFTIGFIYGESSRLLFPVSFDLDHLVCLNGR